MNVFKDGVVQFFEGDEKVKKVRDDATFKLLVNIKTLEMKGEMPMSSIIYGEKRPCFDVLLAYSSIQCDVPHDTQTTQNKRGG